MAQIVVNKTPSKLIPADIYQVQAVNLLDWLVDNMTPNMADLHCEILLNGVSIARTWDLSPEELNAAVDVELGVFDSVVINIRPQGVDPFSLAIIAAVAIGAALVVIALTPKPKVPGQETESRDSNNQLNSASNAFRPRQAIPDIAGKIVSYPDFIQPSYYEYQNGQRVFREMFCIGKGFYDIGVIKEGDTDIVGISGYESVIYQPGEPVDGLLNVRTAASSVDIDLLSAETQTKTLFLEGAYGARVVEPDTITLPLGFIESIELEAGSLIDFEVQFVDGSDNIITETGTDIEVISVSGAFLVIDYPFTVTGDIVYGYITNKAFEFVAPWITLEGDQIEQIWFNLIMPQGIRKGDGTIAQVSAVCEAQMLDEFGDPVGALIQRGATFIGKTQSPQRQTFKLGAEDGITPARYRARATRITASLGDNALDLLTLEGISSVTPYTASFGDVTLIKLIRRSSQRVNRGASNKINALVTRKLRIYNHITGVYGTDYVATRRFCDWAFYLLHERMKVPIDQINTDELFGIFDNLSDDQLGYFDYSFSDKNISARERLLTCCNVARVRFWNEGLIWSFVREEAKPFKLQMFNRRNLKAAASTYVQKFRRPADNDGVTVSYVDPDKNAQKQVSRRITSAGAIESGLGLNPLEINLAGCRNVLQATNRCELEVRRLIYQGIKVTDTALNDALTTRLGDRVDWVDVYDSELFDGELLSVTGNVYTTSERFTPEAGIEYWVYITDSNGAPSNSVRAYPRADGNIFGFQADGLTGAYLANGVIQSGSRYVIASNSDLDASRFTVISRGRPNDRGECQIEFAEYNPLMFGAD